MPGSLTQGSAATLSSAAAAVAAAAAAAAALWQVRTGLFGHSRGNGYGHAAEAVAPSQLNALVRASCARLHLHVH